MNVARCWKQKRVRWCQLNAIPFRKISTKNFGTISTCDLVKWNVRVALHFRKVK